MLVHVFELQLLDCVGIKLQLYFDCNSITNKFSIITLKFANDLEFFL